MTKVEEDRAKTKRRESHRTSEAVDCQKAEAEEDEREAKKRRGEKEAEEEEEKSTRKEKKQQVRAKLSQWTWRLGGHMTG